VEDPNSDEGTATVPMVLCASHIQPPTSPIQMSVLSNPSNTLQILTFKIAISGGHIRMRVRGWEGPNYDEGTAIAPVVLCGAIYNHPPLPPPPLLQ
jgi:hypothetical protein